MMRVQHEFARHNEEYTALDVVGFPYTSTTSADAALKKLA